MRIFALALLSALVCSCAAAGSARQYSLTTPGMSYRLPMTRASIDVGELNGQIIATVTWRVTGDPSQAYVVDLEDRPFTHNTLTVTTDAEHLLTKVEVNSQAQLVAVLDNIVASAATKHGGEATPTRIFRGDYDALTLRDPTTLNTLNAAVWARIDEIIPAAGCGAQPAADKAAELAVYQRCTSLERMRTRHCGNPCAAVSGRRALITATLTQPTDLVQASQPAPQEQPADLCSRGICIREPIPYQFALTVGDRSEQETAWLANGQTPIVLPLRNAVFADRHITLLFTGGAVSSIVDDHSSDAAGFASIPLKLASAIIEAAAAPLGFRTAAQTRETAYLNAQAAVLTAEIGLRAKCVEAGADCAPPTGAPASMTVSVGAAVAQPSED